MLQTHRHARVKFSLGFTLIEVMVAVGVFAIVAVAVGSTFTTIFKMQRQVVVKDESNEFNAAVARFIFTDKTCTPALKNQSIDVGAALKLPGYTGYGAANGAVDLSVGTKIASKIQINKLELKKTGMPVQTVQTSGGAGVLKNFDRYLVQINLQTVDLNVAAASGATATPIRTFEIPVLVDPGTKLIFACYFETSLNSVCEALGQKFDAATSKCVPEKQCTFEGAFSVNTCTPAGYGCPPDAVNPMTSASNCPSGAAAQSQTGLYTWSYVASCGKKCSVAVNVQTTYYVCMNCP